MGPPLISGGNSVTRGDPRAGWSGASMGPPLISGGNEQFPAGQHGTVGASMGPPLISGGNRRPPCGCRFRTPSFNGAAADQRRK